MGLFSSRGKSDLVFIEGTVNSTVYQLILNDELLKDIDIYFSGFDYVFQQDNTPCHTSKSTTNYLESNNINTMAWRLNLLILISSKIFGQFLKEKLQDINVNHLKYNLKKA